jgi:hypothetical protein
MKVYLQKLQQQGPGRLMYTAAMLKLHFWEDHEQDRRQPVHDHQDSSPFTSCNEDVPCAKETLYAQVLVR